LVRTHRTFIRQSTMTDSTPLVSIIIPTWNRPLGLERALRSIHGQEYPNLEVIVINDGGASPCAICESFDPLLRLRLIDLDVPIGPAGARNLGLINADGPLLAFLDDDDVFLPSHLSLAVNALLASPADLVYTGAVVSRTWRDRLPQLPAAMPLKALPFNDSMLLAANFIHTGAVVVRNFASSDVRFDEDLRYCEDWDLWLALRTELGFRMSLVNAICTIYHQVPGADGLVSEANLRSPTPFELARNRIECKYPTQDPIATKMRSWLAEFESARNQVVAAGWRFDPFLFDRVLWYLWSGVSCRRSPVIEDVERFFRRPRPPFMTRLLTDAETSATLSNSGS